MGTASDWTSAVFAGMFWAGTMLLWDFWRESDEHLKQVLSLANVLSLALLGLAFGIGTTFRRKAFHWPLILIVVVTFVCGVVFARLAKRKRGSEV
jgi:hypothetical protein